MHHALHKILSLRLHRFVRRLWHDRADTASLAIVRVCLGALMLFDAAAGGEFLFNPNPGYPFSLKYPFFSWVEAFPAWAPALHYLLITATLGVIIGLFYRLSMALCATLFAYSSLLAAEYYLNHLYLLVLTCVLMCFAPAHRRWSLDRKLSFMRATPYDAPVFYLWVLRLQVEIVLLFAGIVKISPDWLRLEPLRSWLREAQGAVFFGSIWQYDWAVAISAYGAIVLHLVGAPLLLYRRTRLPVFALYCAFHIINHFIFNIGIFPWMTIALSTLFFAPDWPLALGRRLSARNQHGAVSPCCFQEDGPHGFTLGQKELSCTAALWFFLQITLPLRHYAYPGNVDWTDEAQILSWRMKLIERHSPGFTVVVYAAARSEIFVPRARALLSPRQYDKVSTQPGLMQDFARQMKQRYQLLSSTGDLRIHVFMPASYNYRPHTLLIDPMVDLGAQPLRVGPDPWLITENPHPVGNLESWPESSAYSPPPVAHIATLMGLPAISTCIFEEEFQHERCILAK